MEYIGLLVTSVCGIVIPWVVQLIKSKTIIGSKALVLSIALSIIGAIVTGLASGIPIDPASWSAFVILVVVSVQGFYSMFKAAGVTSRWMDALLAVDVKARK